MKPTPSLTALAACVALLLSGQAARGDDVPSFSKLREFEKDFVTKMGTSIVKAARFSPSKIELSEYKFEEVKDRKDRKDLKITMTWVGLTKKTYTSTIVVKIDVSDEKKWEALNVEYKDTAGGNPNQNKIQALIKEFNR